MSPRTVQIWFQNKRQSWRAHRAKLEGTNATTQQTGQQAPTPTPSAQTFSPHPLRQEHYGSSPGHGRAPPSVEEGGREEGMENDEGGGWEALRQAQEASRDYRPGGSADPDEDVGFDDDMTSPHSRHR